MIDAAGKAGEAELTKHDDGKDAPRVSDNREENRGEEDDDLFQNTFSQRCT